MSIPSSHLHKNSTVATSIYAGNPGAGKSTLMNCVAEEQLFKGGPSYDGSGVTVVSETRTSKRGKIFVDTPGLVDIQTQEQAGLEIHKALAQGGCCEGQVREDQYAVLINRCNQRWLEGMNRGNKILSFMNQQWKFLTDAGVPCTKRFHFVPEEEEYSWADNALFKLPAATRHFLEKDLPVVHIDGSELKALDMDHLLRQAKEAEHKYNAILEQLKRVDDLVKSLEQNVQKLLVSSKLTSQNISAIELTKFVTTLALGHQKSPTQVLAWSAPASDTCVHEAHWDKVQEYVDSLRVTIGCQILAADGEILGELGADSSTRAEGSVARLVQDNGQFSEWRMYTSTHERPDHFGETFSNASALMIAMLSKKTWLPYNNPLAGYDLHRIMSRLSNDNVTRNAHAIVAWRGKSVSEQMGIYFGEVTGFIVYDSAAKEIFREGSHFKAGAWTYRIDISGNPTMGEAYTDA